MKHISPQLGFNNNVRHRGRVFHIQTEDSGVKHPHIITHLFADGGRILKSTKTSYAEFLGEDELPKKVRSLMQEQHKAMFIALRGGKFDHLFGENGEPVPNSEVHSGRASLPSLTSAAEFAHEPASAAPAAAAPVAAPQPPAPAPEAAAAAEEDSGPPTIVEPTVEAAEAPAPEPPPPTSSAPPSPPPSNRAVVVTTPGASPTAMTQQVMPVTVRTTQEAPRKPRLTPPPPRPPEPQPAIARAEKEPPERSMSPLRALANRPPIAEPRAAMPSNPGPAATGNTVSRTLAALAETARSTSALTAAAVDGARAPRMGSDPAAPRKAESLKPASAPGAAPRPPSVRPPSVRPPMPATLDLDLEALERAAVQNTPAKFGQIQNLPPPPTALLRPANTSRNAAPLNTGYRSVTPQATQIVSESKPAPQKQATPPKGNPPASTGVQKSPTGSGRYAPSRPASIFGNSRPTEGSSIFGEDLISEKSLDEVILSYLAEDLESPPNKK
ncbi:MAG: hypothetical protein U0271_15450 [Polyangiaceae bacterium]